VIEGDIKRDLYIAAEMKNGMKNNEFNINYHPIYNLKVTNFPMQVFGHGFLYNNLKT
jgi:hypothetical protein